MKLRLAKVFKTQLKEMKMDISVHNKHRIMHRTFHVSSCFFPVYNLVTKISSSFWTMGRRICA